jgi:hypothetical protein
MIRPHPRRAGLLVAFIALALLFGCMPAKPKIATLPPDEGRRPPAPVQTGPAQPPPAKHLPIAQYRNQRFYVHQVRWPQESLELVAQWYTGKRANRKILARVTPNLKGGRLTPGDVVFIPLDILQIETPMPRQYVAEQRSAGQPPPAPTPNAGRDDDPPQPKPYGPRPFPKSAKP